VALEGPEFRHMPIHDLLPLLPKLQVRHHLSVIIAKLISSA
jgi:hypothetical protein